MSAGSAQDTTAEATELLLDRWRAMSPAERMAVADRLSIDIAVFAMAGARSRAPAASETALRHEVARRRYGQALADAAYAELGGR